MSCWCVLFSAQVQLLPGNMLSTNTICLCALWPLCRYGDNPNRVQRHTQFQVILKPDPGNAQELYLGSLEALGIDTSAHDVRYAAAHPQPQPQRHGCKLLPALAVCRL